MSKIHDIGEYLTQTPKIGSKKDREWISHAEKPPGTWWQVLGSPQQTCSSDSDSMRVVRMACATR